jgi:ribosome-associated heat shock protein Hsp15
MEIRADTYLWAIRMYKSRTLAGTAIKGGKVKLNDENFKPSRIVKIGERYTLSIGTSKKIIEVIAITDKRGNYEIAKTHYTDHSPIQTKEEKLESVFYTTNIKRDKGSGRPTKKDRRDIFGFNDSN